MHRLFPLFLLLACSGTDDDDTLLRPETCDDGVDNNDNGLVDCDDTAFCGGLACQDNTDTDDTDLPPPDLEIVFDPSGCCDFEFTTGDCPKAIGTFGVRNASLDIDAEIDTSCDLVGGGSVIQWQIQGGAAPAAFIVNAPLYTESSATIEGFFNCGVNQTFTTHCRIKIEDLEGGETAEYEFDITGTSSAP